MKKKIAALLCAATLVAALAGCASQKSAEMTPAQEKSATSETSVTSEAENTGSTAEDATKDTQSGEKTQIQVFIAASLNTVMTDLAEKYNATHPDVEIVYNADSSGKLMDQIENGFACDIFFSAAAKQMDQLETDGLLVDGTRKNVVNNQVVVVTRKDSGTVVTGLADIGKASSIALADGSVPVGKYTRQAMVNLGLLEQTEDVSAITTKEVSDALGGVEISERGNVSQVLMAVAEGNCEVGTTYYSDTYGYEDQLDILEKVSYDLTGNVIYPIAEVKNEEASAEETAAAEDFLAYVVSDEAKSVFENYYFDTDVE